MLRTRACNGKDRATFALAMDQPMQRTADFAPIVHVCFVSVPARRIPSTHTRSLTGEALPVVTRESIDVALATTDWELKLLFGHISRLTRQLRRNSNDILTAKIELCLVVDQKVPATDERSGRSRLQR